MALVSKDLRKLHINYIIIANQLHTSDVPKIKTTVFVLFGGSNQAASRKGWRRLAGKASGDETAVVWWTLETVQPGA
ncbi:hypothetical protein HC256_000180 [Beauveria bassiana]|nr:hypothetical protein HC256_000180 [Beauveria bassiana]